MRTGNCGLMTGMLAVGMFTACGVASVGDINGFVDAPRLFNDFAGSSLTYMSTYSGGGSTVLLRESDYGTGNFANRHASWFSDGMGSKVDFDYGDGFDMSMTMQVNAADSVGNVEAGFQADLFGFGLFGVQTASGEVAAFGSTMPFHSFGAGIYNVGDEISLRMIHRPGAGEFSMPSSTIEYMYNNLTTGTGWVSSGEIAYTSTEGGIPSGFEQYFGVGAQINSPDAVDGNVSIDFRNIVVPAPGAAALLGLGGLVATRRRR